MKKLEIQTEYPCLVSTENEQTFLSPVDILEVEASQLLVYPVESKNILPFKIDFEKPKGKNYYLLERDNKTFCFLYSLNLLSKKSISTIKVGSISVMVKISQSEILINCDKEELTFPVEENLIDYTLSSWQNHLCGLLKFKTFERLFLYNPKNGVFKIYKGKNFEIKNEITFDQMLANFARSKISKKISLSNEELKEETLSSKHQNYHLQEESVCYAFLDSVLQNNFSLAKELLCEELKETDSNKIREYFGIFFKFFPLSSNEFVLIYKNQCKTISFTTKNNKIFDFEFM